MSLSRFKIRTRRRASEEIKLPEKYASREYKEQDIFKVLEETFEKTKYTIKISPATVETTVPIEEETATTTTTDTTTSTTDTTGTTSTSSTSTTTSTSTTSTSTSTSTTSTTSTTTTSTTTGGLIGTRSGTLFRE